MGRVVRDDRPPGDVHIDHVAEVEEVDLVERHAEIRPVNAHDVDRLLRHFERLHNGERVVAAGAQRIGEVLLHILGVVGGAVKHIHLGGADLLNEIEEFFQRLAGAGDIAFDRGDVRLAAAGDRNVHGGAVGIGGDRAVAVRDGDPVDLHAVLFHDEPDVALVVVCAVVADLVHAGVKLKSASLEAGGDAAGQVVLFDEEGLFALRRAGYRRAQTGVSRADDHNIILFRHKGAPFRAFFLRDNSRFLK